MAVLRRKFDWVWLVSAVIGALVLAGTIALKLKHGADFSDVAFGIGMGVGAGLISPQFIMDLVAKRFGIATSRDPNAAPPGGTS